MSYTTIGDTQALRQAETEDWIKQMSYRSTRAFERRKCPDDACVIFNRCATPDTCRAPEIDLRDVALAQTREALRKISQLSSWWGAQQIALDALEATKGFDNAAEI